MADTKDLKSFDENHVGSTPTSGTNREIKIQMIKALVDRCLRDAKDKMNRITYLNEPLE